MGREFRICDLNEINQRKEEIIRLIAGGEAVDEGDIRTGIERAKLIVGCFEDDRLIGVGAIKRPLDSYKKRIYKNTKPKDDIRPYDFELGYVSVKPQYWRQGIGTELVHKLLELEEGKLFATTSNSGMREILLSNDFVISGEPYLGRRKDKIRLLVRRK